MAGMFPKCYAGVTLGLHSPGHVCPAGRAPGMFLGLKRFSELQGRTAA